MLLALSATQKFSSDFSEALNHTLAPTKDAMLSAVAAINPSVAPAAVKSQDEGRKHALLVGAGTAGLGALGAGMGALTGSARSTALGRYGLAAAPIAMVASYGADRANASGYAPDSPLQGAGLAAGLMGGAGLATLGLADMLPLRDAARNTVRTVGRRALALGLPAAALGAGAGLALRKQSEVGVPEALLTLGAVPTYLGVSQAANLLGAPNWAARTLGGVVGAGFALQRRDESKRYGQRGMTPVYGPGEKFTGSLMSGAINTGIGAGLSSLAGSFNPRHLPATLAALSAVSYANRTGTEMVMRREADQWKQRQAGLGPLKQSMSIAQQTGTLMGGRSSRAMFGGGILGVKRSPSLNAVSSKPGARLGRSFGMNLGGIAPAAPAARMSPLARPAQPRPTSTAKPAVQPARPSTPTRPARGPGVGMKLSTAPAMGPAGAFLSGAFRAVGTPLRALWSSPYGKAGILGTGALVLGAGAFKAGQPVRKLQDAKKEEDVSYSRRPLDQYTHQIWNGTNPPW